MVEFEQEKQRLEQFLSKNDVWALATGSGNDVSVRSVSIMHRGLKIYFQTDVNFEKSRHIRENPRVALCCINYQIKGHARIIGLTTSGANAELMELYKKAQPDAYRHYSHMKTSCLVEIDPESVQIWDYSHDEPYITRMDLIQGTAESRKYE